MRKKVKVTVRNGLLKDKSQTLPTSHVLQRSQEAENKTLSGREGMRDTYRATAACKDSRHVTTGLPLQSDPFPPQVSD